MAAGDSQAAGLVEAEAARSEQLAQIFSNQGSRTTFLLLILHVAHL